MKGPGSGRSERSCFERHRFHASARVLGPFPNERLCPERSGFTRKARDERVRSAFVFGNLAASCPEWRLLRFAPARQCRFSSPLPARLLSRPAGQESCPAVFHPSLPRSLRTMNSTIPTRCADRNSFRFVILRRSEDRRRIWFLIVSIDS